MFRRAQTLLAIAGAIAIVMSELAATNDAAHRPDFSGRWKLDHERSDDIRAKVEHAAGSQYVQGHVPWATWTVIPWGKKNEGERVTLRDVLLAATPKLETLEIEQTSAEITTVLGETGTRIFRLDRSSSGTTLVTQEKVKRQTKWKDGALWLESSGGSTKSRESLTLGPTKDQLVYVLHVEIDPLEHPLDLRLVYQRAAPQDGP